MTSIWASRPARMPRFEMIWPRILRPRSCAASDAAFISSSGHGHHVGRPRKPVTAGRIELDNIDAVFDFLPHRLAEFVRAVAIRGPTLHPEPPPARMEIHGIAGRHDVMPASEEARPRNQALVDRVAAASRRYCECVPAPTAPVKPQRKSNSAFFAAISQHRGRMLHVEFKHDRGRCRKRHGSGIAPCPASATGR